MFFDAMRRSTLNAPVSVLPLVIIASFNILSCGTLLPIVSTMSLTDSIQQLGAFAVRLPTDAPGILDTAKAVQECRAQPISQERSFHLSGAVRRSTLAFDGTGPHGWCSTSVLNARINDYYSAMSSVSALAAETIDQFAGIPSASTMSMRSVVALGECKNHIHVYEFTGSGISHDERVVPMHVDAGLMLILSPAVYPSVGKVASADLLLGGNDLTTEVNADVQHDYVVILVGAAAAEWLGAARARASLHGVRIPNADDGSRVVIARMYVAAPNTLNANGVAYSSYINAVVAQSRAASHSSWTATMEKQCEAGDAYCWHDCLPAPQCGDSDSQSNLCMNLNTAGLCGEDDHNCRPVCARHSPNALIQLKPQKGSSTVAFQGLTSKAELFCSGKTSMSMTGFFFAFPGSVSNPCIAYLFPQWVLKSPGQFWWGMFVSFVFGLTVEIAVLVRRIVNSKAAHEHRRRARLVWRGTGLFLFGLNISIAYICMLVAMTYCVELFIAVVLGLTVGHLVFGNLRSHVKESADPCCVSGEPCSATGVKVNPVPATTGCACSH